MSPNRILVIEDTRSLREEIAETLRFEGFDVATAENGVIGLETARGFRPDLVVCDILMPGPDGFATLRSFRADPAVAQVPFVFLTAKASREDVRGGMALGADDYITKPYTTDELLESIRSRLRRHRNINEDVQKSAQEQVGRVARLLPQELRVLLHRISSSARLLADEHEVLHPEEVEDAARHILGACERLDRLVGNFLLLAEVEVLTAKGVRPSPRSNPAVDLREDILAVAMKTAADFGRPDDLELSVGEAKVHVSGEHLLKIVAELVDNAFRYSEPGTPVRVEREVRGATCVLRVIDQGRGMRPEEILAVDTRRPFHQAGFESEGMGLGLTLSRRLAELHGGKLTVVSAPGTGTTGIVELPAVPTNWQR